MLKKSIILIILVILLSVAAVFALSACNNPNNLDFAFITDTHVVANEVFTAENYVNFANKDKMIHLTDAILNTIADDIIASKTKYVLFGGDLTENGDLESHNAVVDTLKRLKDAGKQLFVINGNHDTDIHLTGNKISQSKFAELYNDFGYSQAIARYEGTLSYVADLNKKYRLIAIDNIEYKLSDGNTKNDFDADHKKWVSEQVDLCNAEGKTPIIIAHKPFIQHMPKVTEFILDRNYYTSNKTFIKELADKNCNYSFTGHMHLQSVKSITNDKEETFTDVETSSMSFYPASYRKVLFTKKKVEVSTLSISKINLAYVSEFSGEEERTKISGSFADYCYSHFSNFISGEFLGKIVGADGLFSEDKFEGELQPLAEILSDIANKVLNNPLYIKDENNNLSLERILLYYNITLPESSYKTASELAAFFAGTLFAGDENIKDSDEITILKNVATSLFYYIDTQSDAIKTALPDYEKINIDLNLLFKDGILECYDSNLLPLIISVANNSINSSIISSALKSIKNDFNSISTLESLIKAYTAGSLEGITSYFSGKTILWYDLFDSIFNVYAADLMMDEYPADNNFAFKR